MRRSAISTAFSSVLTLVLAGPALASSSEAWAEHDRAVIERCVAASQFTDAAPAGEPIIFDDDAGMTALLVQGHYSGAKAPQAQASQAQASQVQKPRAKAPMNGRAGQELCLFQRSSQEIYITDADKLAIGSDALPSTPTDAINDTKTDAASSNNQDASAP